MACNTRAITLTYQMHDHNVCSANLLFPFPFLGAITIFQVEFGFGPLGNEMIDKSFT